MKKILFVLAYVLFLSAPCLALSPMFLQTIQSPDEGGASCTTATDSALTSNAHDSDDGGLTNEYVCQKVTIAATSTITEFVGRLQDEGSDTGSVIASLWSHDGGTDEPDVEDVSTRATVAMSLIDASYENQAFTLGTPDTGIANNTYWACLAESGSAMRVSLDTSAATGRICFSNDGSAWTCVDNRDHNIVVWGCAE